MTLLVLALVFALLSGTRAPALPAAAVSDRYEGRFCAGEGDTDFLRLIDESFAFFYPNAAVPNLTTLYQPEWDTFVEAGGWRGWWIQNSYGLSYAATPFLPEPWFSTMQRSWDLFWDNQGDGKRKGGWEGPRRSRRSGLSTFFFATRRDWTTPTGTGVIPTVLAWVISASSEIG